MDRLHGHLVDGLFPAKDLCSMDVHVRRPPFIITVNTEARRSLFIESKERPSLPFITTTSTAITQCKLVISLANYGELNPAVYWKVDTGSMSKGEMIRQLTTLEQHNYFFSDDSPQLYRQWFSFTYRVYIGSLVGSSIVLGEQLISQDLTVLWLEPASTTNGDGSKLRATRWHYTDKLDEPIEEPLTEDFDVKALSGSGAGGDRRYNLIGSPMEVPWIHSMETNYSNRVHVELVKEKCPLKVYPKMPHFIAPRPPTKELMLLLLLLSQLSQVSLIYLLKWLQPPEPDHKSLLVKLCKQICVTLDHLAPTGEGCLLVHPRESQELLDQLDGQANSRRSEVESRLENKYAAQALIWCTEHTNVLLRTPIIHVDFRYFYPTLSATVLPKELRHRTGMDIRQVMRQLISLRQQFELKQQTGTALMVKAMKSIAVTITGKFHERHSFLYDSIYYYHVLMYGRQAMSELQQFIVSSMIPISRSNPINRSFTPEPLLIQTDGGYFRCPVVTSQRHLDQIQREVDEYLVERYQSVVDDSRYQPRVKVTLIGNMCIINQSRYVYLNEEGQLCGSKNMPMKDPFWAHYLRTGEPLDGDQYKAHREELTVNSNKKRKTTTVDTPAVVPTTTATTVGKWLVVTPPDVLLLKSPQNGGYQLTGERIPKRLVIRRLPSLLIP